MSDKALTVDFTPEAVRKYLDRAIAFWRHKGILGKFAPFYVDAYQSVRTSLFGELLPEQGLGELTEVSEEAWATTLEIARMALRMLYLNRSVSNRVAIEAFLSLRKRIDNYLEDLTTDRQNEPFPGPPPTDDW